MFTYEHWLKQSLSVFGKTSGTPNQQLKRLGVMPTSLTGLLPKPRTDGIWFLPLLRKTEKKDQSNGEAANDSQRMKETKEELK